MFHLIKNKINVKKYVKSQNRSFLINNIELNDHYFSSGTERRMYINPSDENTCIKIFHNNKCKSNLYNSSSTELYFYKHCVKEEDKKYFSEAHHFINTSKRIGVLYTTIKNDDKEISMKIKKYLNTYGLTNELKLNILILKKMLIKNIYMIRDFNSSNILVKMNNDKIINLVIIDYPKYMRLSKIYKRYNKYRINHKFNKLIYSRSPLGTSKQF
jgi:hypothetical protein